MSNNNNYGYIPQQQSSYGYNTPINSNNFQPDPNFYNNNNNPGGTSSHHIANMDPIIFFISSLSSLIFFGSDFYLAYTLNKFKKDHPAIDDAAPVTDSDEGEENEESEAATLRRRSEYASPGGESAQSDGGFSSLVGGVGSDHRRTPNADPSGATNESIATSINSALSWSGFSEIASTVSAKRFSLGRQQRLRDYTLSLRHYNRSQTIHLIVITAAIVAPIVNFLQIVSPLSMSWSMVHVPTWLAYLCTLPGLGLCFLYAARASRVVQYQEVSKAQWLSLMWFRLDVICCFAIFILFGTGNWSVGACLLGVDIYLCRRLLRTEKNLSRLVRATQLLPNEFDDRDETGQEDQYPTKVPLPFVNPDAIDFGGTSNTVKPKVKVESH